ncbi:phage holin (plasmid) [Enterobacter bugandensis]|uniref:phage holin n=1 Tax=Enterobacter bugandensis TaxID=881260 RepID=UPI00283AA6C0|nr:phage holin [Enterobacter bugandensis]WMU75451.1 phage holin [Enterobacter bugandensis]
MDEIYSTLAYGVPVTTTVMGLTVDHWCVAAAVTGVFCSFSTVLINFYYRYKKDKREACCHEH